MITYWFRRMALVVLFAWSCLAWSAPLPEGTRAFRDVAYVPNGHERQKLDLFLPAAGTNWPVVLWIHGGAWLGGSKEQCPALRLLREGYAVASANYRLSRHAIFPAQIQDCKAAVRWLRAHAAEYGYDGNRIGVWGSSAGGHLVALLGTTGDIKDFDTEANEHVSSAVQAVVDFFGPTDLTRMQEQAGSKCQMDHNAADSPESLLVGGPIQERHAAAAKANPINYISRVDPPFLILHGDADYTVPMGQSGLLHAALQKAGVKSTFHVVKGAGHGFRRGDIDKMVSEFLREHLRPGVNRASR